MKEDYNNSFLNFLLKSCVDRLMLRECYDRLVYNVLSLGIGM
jgi:hypothetical protein